MDLRDTTKISGAGMKVQSARLRVASENLANASTTPSGPGEEPYRRKTIHLHEVEDRDTGLELVDVRRYGVDRAPFGTRFDPSHPAADEDGTVATPNVTPLIELMDIREAQRSYEANLSAMGVTRSMIQRTIDLLR
ncbi:MAG: flagellar basal body rod protein FlgC [Geminicoccaceae bacterium]